MYRLLLFSVKITFIFFRWFVDRGKRFGTNQGGSYRSAEAGERDAKEWSQLTSMYAR